MARKTLVSALLAAFALSTSAQELTWRKDVAPIVKKRCAECHGAEARDLAEWRLLDEVARKKEGPRLDSYASFMSFVVWPETGALMRRLDDGASAGGKAGNMYEHLGDDGAERAKNLATIKAWLGQGAWNLNRFKARDQTPGVTKEQLEKVVAKY